MTRRCSHCSNNGHNSRTCPSRGGGGVKLFGVRLTDGSIMKKSASMGNLSALYHSSSPAAVSPNPSSPATSDPVEGYLSDDPAHASCSAKRRADRKKGTPWTEEEHRLFLLGLQKLGKGDWRGISRNYVLSRTPTQVASHAQKHFIRQCSATRRKRRSSLFDMPPDMAAEDQFMILPAATGMDNPENSHCSLELSLKPDSDETAPNEIKQEEIPLPLPLPTTASVSELPPPIIPTFYPAFIPIPFPVWPSPLLEPNAGVLKPIPVLSKEAMNLDELVGMSKQLSLKDSEHHHHHHHHMEPSSLSFKLLAEPSRHSAFHASNPVAGSNNKGGSNGF